MRDTTLSFLFSIRTVGAIKKYSVEGEYTPMVRVQIALAEALLEVLRER